MAKQRTAGEAQVAELLATARESLGLTAAFLARMDGPDQYLEVVDSAVPFLFQEGNVQRRETSLCQAILDGKSVAKPASAVAAEKSSRFIVQVGAFADVSSAHEARVKVEKLGLKTYTQAVDTPGGKRIRVRIGPFADRVEADKAAAKLRSTGLATAVLTL